MSSHEVPPEQIFEYRLVRITYVNRIEYEDGPGSLRNIVSDEYKYVIDEWTGNDAFGKELVEDGYWVNRPIEYDDYSETSYRLERRASSASPWKYFGYLTLHSPYDDRY